MAVLLLVAMAGAGCAGADQDPQVATANGTSDARAAGDGGSGDGSGDGSADEAVSDEDRMRSFAACMRENGVDMPDPEPGGGVRIGAPGMEPEVMERAMAACRELMPNGGEPPQLSPEDLEKARAMAACLREHGVDVPDPDPSGGGGVRVHLGEGGEPDREKLDAAMAACRHLGPQRGVRSGGDSPGGSG